MFATSWNLLTPASFEPRQVAAVAEWYSHSRAFGDGPRNFETWSNDEDDERAGTPSLNFYTTPTGVRLSLDSLNVYRPPTRKANTGHRRGERNVSSDPTSR
ncbi:hypothetical protein TNCV_4866311 [Trichonephila clavipes]|nr:hypothetical protein TNCV_4866311 [Trichonephila clavipes]